LVSSSFFTLAAANTAFALTGRAVASSRAALYSPLTNFSLAAARESSSDFT